MIACGRRLGWRFSPGRLGNDSTAHQYLRLRSINSLTTGLCPQISRSTLTEGARYASQYANSRTPNRNPDQERTTDRNPPTTRTTYPTEDLQSSSKPAIHTFRTWHPEGTGNATADVAGEDQEAIERSDSITSTMERQIRLQLTWIRDDPLKVANAVQRMVLTDQFDKAKRTLELAGKAIGKSYTVAWNHLIDGYMKAGHPTKAWKAYNDMKKWGQKPDSYTLTLLLRGLSRNPDLTYGQASRAFQIYQSLVAPNSKVTPLIIHANAALGACSRGKYFSAFWSIIQSLPEKGPMSADKFTYSIALQQLRTEMISHMEKSRRVEKRDEEVNQGDSLEPADTNPSQLNDNLDRTVEQAKTMWEEIYRKAREGGLQADEMVVCELARVFIERRTKEAGLYVLEVMARTIGFGSAPNVSKPETESKGIATKSTADASTELTTKSTETAAVATPSPSSSFTMYPKRANLPDGWLYVPGNPTLSVLLRTFQLLGQKQSMLRAFGLLTRPESEGGYGVKADEVNLSALLYNINFFRSSGDVLRVLESDFPAAGITPTAKHIVLAMESCLNSSSKPEVAMQTAAQILEIAKKHEILSARALEIYVSIGSYNKRDGIATGEVKGEEAVAKPFSFPKIPLHLSKEALDLVIYEIGDLARRYIADDRMAIRWIRVGQNEQQLVRLFNVLRGKIRMYAQAYDSKSSEGYELNDQFVSTFSSVFPIEVFVPALMSMGGVSLKDIRPRGQNPLQIFCERLDQKTKQRTRPKPVRGPRLEPGQRPRDVIRESQWERNQESRTLPSWELRWEANRSARQAVGRESGDRRQSRLDDRSESRLDHQSGSRQDGQDRSRPNHRSESRPNNQNLSRSEEQYESKLDYRGGTKPDDRYESIQDFDNRWQWNILIEDRPQSYQRRKGQSRTPSERQRY